MNQPVAIKQGHPPVNVDKVAIGSTLKIMSFILTGSRAIRSVKYDHNYIIEFFLLIIEK